MRHGRRHASPGSFWSRHAGIPPAKTVHSLLFRIALRASGAALFSSHHAAGHGDAFPISQCIGNPAAGFVEVPPCGPARDPGPFGSRFLFEVLGIDEPDELDRPGIDRDSLDGIFAAAGHVAAEVRSTGNGTAYAGPSPAAGIG